MPAPLRPRLLVDLGPPLAGCHDPVAFGVDCEGAIYAAARRTNEATTVAHGIGIFPKSRLDEPTEYVVLRWRAGELRTLVVRESLLVSYVQPFPGGLLLAAARCHHRREGAEQNAVAVDWSGQVFARLTLGDGIADLRVTPNGTMWGSYIDEGIFGNYGWGPADGPRPIGESGLVSFSSDGQRGFQYDWQAAGTDAPAEIYATNAVGDDDVWIYPYTDFPIVRIHGGSYTVWKTRTSGAHALAVRENRVLLVGGYQDPGRARILDLSPSGNARVTGTTRLTDDKGAAVGHVLMYGAGAVLYMLLPDRRVFVLDDW